MLLRFICENFLSFGKETDLNLTAVSAETQHSNHLRRPVESRKEQVLRAAALYGANASGKSNLIKAMAFAREFILQGAPLKQPIPGLMPFRLRQGMSDAPSRFEFFLATQGRLYEYGFVATGEKVLEEWLYDRTSREARIYERVTGDDGVAKIDIGPSLARKGSSRGGFLQYVGEGTRPNKLYLTECLEKNVQELSPVYSWFSNQLEIITPETYFNQFAKHLDANPAFRKFVARFLQLADTGIQDVHIRRTRLKLKRRVPLPGTGNESADSSDSELKALIAEMARGPRRQSSVVVRDKEGLAQLLRVAFVHPFGSEPDQLVEFLPEEESDGTLRLTDFLPVLYQEPGEDHTYVIDELDRSLHPMLVRALVDYFLTHTSTDSQMLFSTHETHLLDLDLLRRDEIWFLEKDKEQSSQLYSLAQFKPRKDSRIEKGYLQGRYGAVPFLVDPSWLDLPEQTDSTHPPESSEHAKNTTPSESRS